VTLTSFGGDGLYYPWNVGLGRRYDTSNGGTIDAATEKQAYIGRIKLPGGVGTSKTISAAGGGSIVFRPNATTFANGSTTLEIGLQDVDSTTGVPVRPDGTFDVSRVLTGGVDTINANALNTIAMTGGSGSKTLTHGDLVAIVFDMTARAGADSIVFGTMGGTNPQLPTCVQNLTGTWATSFNTPIVAIIFDDASVGMLDGGYVHGGATTESYQDSSNPDERGIAFQVPVDCTLDQLWAYVGVASAAADQSWDLYSDPFGTPTSIISGPITVLAEAMAQSNAGTFCRMLAATVNLTRATNYVFAIKGTSTGNVNLGSNPIANESLRALFPGGTTIAKATRNNGAGAFTAESPAVTMYQMGVRISHVHETSGGGGASKGKLTGLLG
jgi:hypothetical protein